MQEAYENQDKVEEEYNQVRSEVDVPWALVRVLRASKAVYGKIIISI